MQSLRHLVLNFLIKFIYSCSIYALKICTLSLICLLISNFFQLSFISSFLKYKNSITFCRYSLLNVSYLDRDSSFYRNNFQNCCIYLSDSKIRSVLLLIINIFCRTLNSILRRVLLSGWQAQQLIAYAICFQYLLVIRSN